MSHLEQRRKLRKRGLQFCQCPPKTAKTPGHWEVCPAATAFFNGYIDGRQDAGYHETSEARPVNTTRGIPDDVLFCRVSG